MDLDSLSFDRPTMPRTEAGRVDWELQADEPQTAAGRELAHSLIPRTGVSPLVGGRYLDVDAILAIEREAVAAYVWERLEATPGFNEEMERGRADIAAGRGTPLRPRAHPDEE